MSNKEKDTKINAFKVSVYDDKLINKIKELYKIGQYESVNDLLNRALAIGIEKMYAEFGKPKTFANPIESNSNSSAQFGILMNNIYENSLTQDDLFVIMNCVEAMVATLYNIQLAQIKKDTVSIELIESGYLSTLPPSMQAVKNQMIRRLERKRSMNNYCY